MISIDIQYIYSKSAKKKEKKRNWEGLEIALRSECLWKNKNPNKLIMIFSILIDTE
jgi:hypothetical protein